ncbi:hypothetical protein K470DRAFT_259624 [Piedraia hortae CBS 480.64]|uniref:Protein transport protein sec16 n=1 Tax=Piedraia hortae CBS 480.64 TaxID=1314780 RepID=A0A6A7BVV9_9PEZI|nr:hypothetical protein K470DRAFT_259624 [Piedraia hortae CBS 480.64]
MSHAGSTHSASAHPLETLHSEEIHPSTTDGIEQTTAAAAAAVAEEAAAPWPPQDTLLDPAKETEDVPIHGGDVPIAAENASEALGLGIRQSPDAVLSEPAAHYDHQGAVPDMEAAQSEEPDLPLLQDAEEPTRRETESRTSPVRPAAMGESFPDLNEIPTASADGANDDASIAENWPSFDDDETFGELLGDDSRPKEAKPESPFLDEDQDLAARFEAALDMDLLEGDIDDVPLLDEEEEEPPAQTEPQQTPRQPLSHTPSWPYASRSQFIEQNNSRSSATPDTGLFDIYNTQPSPVAVRPALKQAQSFVDKSKGEYQSPYDLPMEIVKPRKRTIQPQRASIPTPPPRTSSFSGSFPPKQVASPARTTTPASRAGSNFFEEMPIPAKPRTRPAAPTAQPFSAPGFAAPANRALPSLPLQSPAFSPTMLPGPIPESATPPPPPRMTNKYAAPLQQPISFSQPPRPRTQSPAAMVKQSKYAAMPIERPTSAVARPSTATTVTKAPASHKRRPSRPINFIPPADERGEDPLQRWKGQPIFSWNSTGMIVHTFPKYTPAWDSHGGHSMKCHPDSINITDAATFCPMDGRDAKFPGPLPARSKGKKKEVMGWMAEKINDLERAKDHAMLEYNLPDELKKRTEEKLVLWKIVQLFVDNDGTLENKPKATEDVRKILLPSLDQTNLAAMQSPDSALSSEPVDRSLVAQLRQALLHGDRERAVFLAEEKKLWGHALLIASVTGAEAWKQVVQSFVRTQVKPVGSDARSLAAVYQAFAGNSQECVDELVPPSARAGFSLVNKTDGSTTANPLVGLDQWRETLGLIVSNRTANDPASLIKLGTMLNDYGRVEAAHACFLFARAFAKHSGADDPEAHFVLLGANHRNPAESLGNDLDPVILTEIYEWASSFAPSTGASYTPHLQSYKLMHAQQLAAFGYKTKALTYCDHVAQAHTSSTKTSPYYHHSFVQAVSDMRAYLSKAPQDGKSGFLPSIRGGAATLLQRFIEGGEEESEQDDRSRTGIHEGPFGMVNAPAEVYATSAIPIQVATPPPQTASSAATAAAGRYTPREGRYNAPIQRASSVIPAGYHPQERSRFNLPEANGPQPRSASVSRIANSRYAPANHTLTPSPLVEARLGIPRPPASRAGSDHGFSSRRGSNQTLDSYQPSPRLAQEQSPYMQASPSLQPSPTFQLASTEEEPAAETAETNVASAETGGFQPLSPDKGYTPYEPEPYNYTPYEPEPEPEPDTEPEPKPEAPPKPKERKHDDAFLAAVAADNARSASPSKDTKSAATKSGGGWLKWFKSDPSAPEPNKPIKAKLGEESSFYFDKELNKWVNKKGPTETEEKTTKLAPPPMARSASNNPAVAARGAVPPVRAGSVPPRTMPPASGVPPVPALPGMAMPPPSGIPSGIPSGPPSGPPSRADTPASVASAPPGRAAAAAAAKGEDLDELLAGGKKAGTVKRKKGAGRGRYVDVMARD